MIDNAGSLVSAEQDPGPDPSLQKDFRGELGEPPEGYGFLGVILPHTEDIPSEAACQIPKSNDLC